jgi:hypothetical protein
MIYSLYSDGSEKLLDCRLVDFTGDQLRFFTWVRFLKSIADMSDEDKPANWIYDNDILLFDWLDSRESERRVKKMNPNTKSASDYEESYDLNR